MAQQKKMQQPASRPSVLSEEKIIDSDSDDQAAEESDSSVGDPLESVESKKRHSRAPKQSLMKSLQKPNSEVESEDEEMAGDEQSRDESNDGSNASSSSRTKRSAPTKVSAPPRKKAKPTPPTAIAPKAFKPPNGFEKARFSPSDYASDSTAFLAQDLTSKQVWHITAPASVSIKDINPFSISDVQSGKPVFSKNGIDYGFLTGLHKTERLLLADGENVEYAPTKVPISGTYHLRELGRSKARSATDADKEKNSISFTALSTVPSKNPREQPAGMKMRYHPYGSTPASKEGGVSTPLPTFRMPAELPESQSDKSERDKQRQEKRAKEREPSRDADAMDVDPTPSSAVTSPSSGTPAKSASTMVDTSFEVAIETPVKEKKRKKKKHKLADESTL